MKKYFLILAFFGIFSLPLLSHADVQGFEQHTEGSSTIVMSWTETGSACGGTADTVNYEISNTDNSAFATNIYEGSFGSEPHTVSFDKSDLDTWSLTVNPPYHFYAIYSVGPRVDTVGCSNESFPSFDSSLFDQPDGMTPLTMDIVCTKINTASGTVETCSDPWQYYKSNLWDLVVILTFGYLAYRFAK